MNNIQFSTHLPEPTEKEINKTIEKVKTKYDVVISKEDAVKYTKLYYDLEQWFLIEKTANSADGITDEIVMMIKNYIKESRGDDISSDDAQGIAKESLNITIPREKERIGREIKAIIAKYK